MNNTIFILILCTAAERIYDGQMNDIKCHVKEP